MIADAQPDFHDDRAHSHRIEVDEAWPIINRTSMGYAVVPQGICNPALTRGLQTSLGILVGGRGFEPGASRSRNLGGLVH